MRKRLLAAVLALLLLPLWGCAAPPEREDGKLHVVCTLFPYYDFARQIGGEDIEVTLLVAAGRETHSFEPTPLDVITMSRADVFVYNGGESEQWVEELLGSAGEDIPCTVCMMEGAEVLAEEIAEGMQHRQEAEEEGEEEIEYDEHIWTSPVMAMGLCEKLCGALCTQDPAHAAAYRARLANYLAKLTALDGAFRDAVSAGKRELLVFGDRFPLLYFCRTYGLSYRAAFHGCSSDTEPSLATLKYLIDKVREENIPVVYTIELSSQKVARAIAETTGARVAVFQSCQTVSREDFAAGETYLTLMERNLTALKEGLS